jgi:hypothetical protein
MCLEKAFYKDMVCIWYFWFRALEQAFADLYIKCEVNNFSAGIGIIKDCELNGWEYCLNIIWNELNIVMNIILIDLSPNFLILQHFQMLC